MTWLPPHRHTLEDCKRNVAEAGAAAPDPVASPAPLDADRLARALTAYGGAGGRVRLVIPMKAKAVHEAAQSLARLYEYARLEDQP